MQMIKRQRVTVTREEDQIVDVLCNMCGESLKVHECDDIVRYLGIPNGYVSGHYSSPVLPDGTEWRYSLCEPCIGRMFSEFKIPPEMNYDFCGLLGGGKWVDGKYVCPSDGGEK